MRRPSVNWGHVRQASVALLAFAFTLLVILLFYSSVMDARAAADQYDRNTQLVAQNERLIAQIEREHTEAAVERRELQADTKRIADRYDALVAWLQSRGIRVPVGLIAEQVDVDGDGVDDSDEVDRQAAAREKRDSTVNSGPDNPGKSGDSPGKGSDPPKGGNGGGSGGSDSPGKSDGKGKADDRGGDKPKRDKPNKGK